VNTNAYPSASLTRKLGIKEGFIIKLIDAPDYYFRLFTDFPYNVTINEDYSIENNFIHYFVKDAETLNVLLPQLRIEMLKNGMIWVSWPKKSSSLKTDVTEDIIREIALRNGLIDVKVCSVDETWSALKLLIRLKDRKK
jgi:hypothetical protein